MPKRSAETSLESIVKKLKKLEKEVKRSRRNKNTLSISSSSSSSRSSSSSSNSSRAPTPDIQENSNSLETNRNSAEQVETIDLETDTNEIPQNIDIAEVPQNVETGPSGLSSTPDVDILNILGEDPSLVVEYGTKINKDLATRFNHIATSGLSKDARKELLKKYLVPENCVNIAAPQLNAEIKAAVTEQVTKRDKAIESRQKQIAAGISCLSKVISDQLSASEKNTELIKELMNIGRIFCDIQHSESEARRNFCLYSVKKDLKDQLSLTKIDKYLFGNNLIETLKTAKAVTKSSTDLKLDISKKPKSSTSANVPNKHLNWKARAPVLRQPPGPSPRFQLPAARNAPPPRRGMSSMNYSHRPAPNQQHQ